MQALLILLLATTVWTSTGWVASVSSPLRATKEWIASRSDTECLPTRFAGVSLDGELLASLRKLKLTHPTPIQQEAVAPLVSGLSSLVHAPTGTGKTVAYALPLLQRYFFPRSASTKEPVQAMILTPSKELALQISSDILALAGDETLVSLCVSNEKHRSLTHCAPILVGTAHKVLNLILHSTASEVEVLRNLRVLVLDEVDRMMALPSLARPPVSMNPIEKLAGTLRLLHSADTKSLLALMQVVGVSATMGRPLRRDLWRIFGSPHRPIDNQLPFLRPAKDAGPSPGEQPQSSRTRQVVVPKNIQHVALLSSRRNQTLPARLAAFHSQWRQMAGQVRRALLFVPTAEDVSQAVDVLSFWKLGTVISVSSALGLASQAAANRSLYSMLQAAADIGLGTDAAMLSEQRRQPAVVFVAPFSAARGLHIQAIDAVFLTTVPGNMDEYLHLAGRTGRNAPGDQREVRRGVVLTFVDTDTSQRLFSWQIPLEIQFQARKLP